MQTSDDLFIDYTNATGAPTRRGVTIQRIQDASTGVVMIAACHLRRAVRSFRVDRISSAYEFKTGLVIDPLAPFFDQHPKRVRSPAGRLAVVRAALEQADDALQLLLSMARADGILVPSELQVICDYICEHYSAPGLLAQDLFDYLQLMAPPAEPLFELVDRLADRSIEENQQIALAACRVITADRLIHPAENGHFAEYMERMEGMGFALDAQRMLAV